MWRCWALALRRGKFVVGLSWARPLVMSTGGVYNMSLAGVHVVEFGPYALPTQPARSHWGCFHCMEINHSPHPYRRYDTQYFGVKWAQVSAWRSEGTGAPRRPTCTEPDWLDRPSDHTEAPASADGRHSAVWLELHRTPTRNCCRTRGSRDEYDVLLTAHAWTRSTHHLQTTATHTRNY